MRKKMQLRRDHSLFALKRHNHGTIWEWFGPISKKRDKHNRVLRCHLT